MDNTVAQVYDASTVSMDELKEKWLALGFTEADEMLTAIMYAGAQYLNGEPMPDYDGTVVKIFSVSEGSGNGDWTLDEKQRFMTGYILKDGNILPSPGL